MAEEIKNTTEEELSEEVKQTPATEEAKEEGGKKEKTRELKKEIASLSEKVKELEARLLQAEDKYVRLAAEYDNYRKRSLKEKESAYSDAYVDCIAELLPIIDNLERAVMFPDSDKVVEGVKMTLTSLKDLFAKMGVAEVETEVFDPNFHNAVAHEDNDELGESVITDVFLKGYTKDGKVIRFAMVKVAN